MFTRRRLTALVVAAVLSCGGHAMFSPVALPAQTQSRANSGARDTAWNDVRADSLIARAVQLRSRQLADSTLLSYHATAHGFLAFLVQLGEGKLIAPKVVQSEELALSVSWWQPGRSAQQLIGRRDTTLLPADVGYYRDRYAVVLDNLPDRIRLGDGQDVADVPHPLSLDATSRYEYRSADGFDMNVAGGRKINVDKVEFRPRDPSKPGTVGSVYLDRATGGVVRLSMTFTRSAILDKRIETLVVTLENTLARERYWLPHAQEVEVVRGSTWLDLPIRGVVRGRWEIAGYDINEKIPNATMTLPRWSSLSRAELQSYKFEGKVADVLPPEMRLAGDDDVAAARKMAEQAVRASALAQHRNSSAFGRGISDLARFSRTEGIAAGFGLSHHWGDAWQSTVRARYGFSDQEVKGRFTLGRAPALGGAPTMEFFAERDYRDVATPERSGIANSLHAIFGSDFTTQVDMLAAGVNFRPSAESRFTLRVAGERDEPLDVHAKPLTGSFAPTLPAWNLEGARAELRAGGSSFSSNNPLSRRLWSMSLAAGAYRGDSSARDSTGARARNWSTKPLVARFLGEITFERALRNERMLVLRSSGGVSVGKDIPPQWLVFAGGPYSAPGYAWSSLAGKAELSQRVEFRQPIPGPSIPLGKYGRAPGRIVLAPYVQAAALAGAPKRNGLYPSVGVGALFFFDLLRFDAAHDLRYHRWNFGIDIDRGFWGLM